MIIRENPTFRAAACEELDFHINAGGFRIHARSILPVGTSLTGNGPTLVFLHEALGSVTQWRGFPSALAGVSGLPALAYDRVGHGKSQAHAAPPATTYLETEAWERLPEVLSACGVQAPLLVGHGEGATLALLAAARCATGTVAVIAEAPKVYQEPAALRGIWRTLHAYETTSLKERLRSHHGDRVDALFHSWSQMWLSPAFRDWSVAGQLSAITCPLLAIQGEDDEHATPDQLRAVLEGAGGPVQGLLLPGCARAPHFQAREPVLAAMARFIRQVLADWDGRR